MSVCTDAVAIKNRAVKKFTSSSLYRELDHDELIFAEFEAKDGSKLYLFNPNRSVQIDGLNLADYVWVSIDDEDNLSIMGEWSEFEFDLDVYCQMMWLVDKKEQVNNLIKSFDYSILLNKKFEEIIKKIIDSGNLVDDQDEELLNEAENILEEHNLTFDDFYDLAKSVHEKNFLRDTNFDTSYSTENTFIGKFEPNLIQLIKYKDLIEDITNDLAEFGEDVFACSTYDTLNYELIEHLKNSKYKKETVIQMIDLETLKNYPSIKAYGFIGSGANGWEGELELGTKGVQIIRIIAQ